MHRVRSLLAYDKEVASEDKTDVIARRPQADEAISDCPRVAIAAPAFGWLAMTCEAFATNLSYALGSWRLAFGVDLWAGAGTLAAS